jgi:hypothetical protein
MATQEISDYVNGLSSATLAGTEELYLDTDEKCTVDELKDFIVGKIWKAQITQTGTNAPVLTVLVNTLGVTAVPAYSTNGEYNISGFDSNLDGLVSVETSFPRQQGYLTAVPTSTSNLYVVSLNTGSSPANDILDVNFQLSAIITVTKYD